MPSIRLLIQSYILDNKAGESFPRGKKIKWFVCSKVGKIEQLTYCQPYSQCASLVHIAYSVED